MKCSGEAKMCPYGYQKKDGCEICRCHDPCNPPGKVIIYFQIYIFNDEFFLISLYFVDLRNDVLSIKNPMEHLELAVIQYHRENLYAVKMNKRIQQVVIRFSRKIIFETCFFLVDCNQPKIVGMCKAAFPRFYYDSSTKNCESFIYGGCQGNENNFETKDQCEKTCKINE